MSVRARGPAPVLQTANAAGSRLEAVLAAGMARMALVPTDAPKRGRTPDVRGELAQQHEQDDAQNAFTPEQLRDVFAEWGGGDLDDPSAPTPEQLEDIFAEWGGGDLDDPSAPTPEQLQDMLAELDTEDASAGYPPWVTLGPLAADPPYPEDSSADKPGKNRLFTVSELKYVYWNVMHPERMNREEMKSKLVLDKKRLGWKIDWMRFKLKKLGFEVPEPIKPENVTLKLREARRVARAAAAAATATDEEIEAAVDAMVERWGQTDELLLTVAARHQTIKDLARKLLVHAQRIYTDLAKRYPAYARPRDLKKILHNGR